jgi:DNA invertase Pin-like site-specific DNA recombinase
MSQVAYKSMIQRPCEQCGAEVNLHLVSITPSIWKGKCESCGQRMTAQDQHKVVGYLRACTQDQDLEKHKSEILAFASDRKLGKVDWVEEQVSGAKTWKNRELGKVVDTLQEGDWLIVPELSSLGRSTLDILDCLAALREKGVNISAIKGAWNLDGSIATEVFLTMTALFAEIERDLVSTRTREALQARKQAGVKLGRPRGPGKSKLDQFRSEIEALLKTGSTLKYIARRFGSSEANLINWLNKNKIDRRPEYGK